MRKAFGFLFILFVLLASTVLTLYYHVFLTHLDQTPAIFVVHPFDTGKTVATNLEEQKLISSAFAFRLLMRVSGGGRQLMVGRYQFQKGDSPAQILMKLKSGNRVITTLMIPEGLTTKKILQNLLNQGDIFLEPMQTEDSYRQRYPDGTLFPDSYHFHLPTTLNEVLDSMHQKASQTHNQLRHIPMPYPLKTFNDVITLASIVEKETALPQERPIIAAVFLNRLKKSIPLQADPTVVYAISNGLGELPPGKTLDRQDLKITHPFNTYQNRGLPPGPICNPGLASLKAVLNAAKVSFLYFVSDGRDGHLFAKTLQQHLKNVAIYKRNKVLYL